MGLGIALGGLAAGAGVVGGAAISAGAAPGEQSPIVSGTNPLTNPIIAALNSQQLASLGIVDPNIILGSSPIQQMINLARATSGLRAGELSAGVEQIMALFQQFQQTGEVPTLEKGGQFGRRLDKHTRSILAGSTFGSLQELFEAEVGHAEKVQPFLDTLDQLGIQGPERTKLVNDALFSLTGDVAAGSDIEGLTEISKNKLLRGIEDAKSSALAGANFAGTNPGAQLEGLSELEADIDFEALSRALGLASSTQTVQSGAIGLLNALNPSNQAAQFTGLPQPSSGPIIQRGGGGSPAIGQGISGAGQILGGTLANFAPGAPSTSSNADFTRPPVFTDPLVFARGL